MLLASEKILIIDTLSSQIPSLQAVYIFGSQSDDSATRESDIDIAYLSKTKLSDVERWNIAQKLASLLSTDIDLVDIATTNTIFRYQIISKGTRVYGGGYEVESFETLAYSFYLRFKEERQPIVDEIMKNRSVIGKIDG